MTLKELRWAAIDKKFDEYPYISFKDVSDKEWLDVIRTACPWLKYTARPEAAYYAGASPELLASHKVSDYLLQRKEYDAIEISRMVSEINVRSEKHE
jgi:hypothetical protein